ncbi:MAG: hypothetical protein F4Y94_03485 [Chloroflexi bacterium]|nr:hypothetical protein [Chloroflexota bacterium]
MSDLRWDDPVLQWNQEWKGGKPDWRARYRLLQSWYRERILQAPPGQATHGRRVDPVGSTLDRDWSNANPRANFLSQAIADYAAERLPRDDRVRRNLLSSQPLCFNLFGFLRGREHVAAAALSDVLDIPIAAVTLIRVEWKPKLHPLGDRTSFDAFVEYVNPAGGRGFLGVETKYTEAFSRKRSEKPRYTEITEAPDSGFRPGAAEQLAHPLTNQLWRNTLLALAVLDQSNYAEGYSVVLHAPRDEHIESAIDAYYAQREEPKSLLRVATYEDLVAAIEEQPGPDVADWCLRFRQRYLDLTPVL